MRKWTGPRGGGYALLCARLMGRRRRRRRARALNSRSRFVYANARAPASSRDERLPKHGGRTPI